MSLSKNVQGLGGVDIPAALGHRSIRLGTGDMAAKTQVPLFNVLGGDILLTSLYGRITTAMDAANTLIQLHHIPTVTGLTEDLCAEITPHIGSYIVGTIFTITGLYTDPMESDVGHEGVDDSSFVTNLMILTPGVIMMDVTAFANTGVIEWTIHWVPLALRVRVEVA